MKLINKIALGIGWSVIVSISMLILLICLLLFFLDTRPKEPGLRTNSVAVVELSGEILTSKEFIKELREQANNSKVSGIVVKIDSPGGAVGASEEMYRAIKRARDKKPVVCSLGSIAASGGLYASMGCEKIVSNMGTITGSIGVIMMAPNFKDLTKNIGFKMNIIKSGALKDAASPFRDMTEQDRKYLQGIINQSYEQFVNVIATSRGLEVKDVKKFSDGRIILGEEAVKLGLVDKIGGEYEAAKMILEKKGLAGEPHLVYKKENEFTKLMQEITESRFFGFLRETKSSQLKYQLL